MGLGNFPGVALFPGRSVRFLRKQKRFGGNWREIVDYELQIWELFLKSPRFTAPISLLGDTPQIEIYTDACDWDPFEKGSINWESVIGIG